MNYTEAIQYLLSLGNEVLAMKLGLETVRRLAERLGNPQRKFPAVHIAGTNGKGSTAAMAASVAQAAGLRTGLYTSPHLVSITERIRVNFKPITPTNFARLAGEVRAAGEALAGEAAAGGGSMIVGSSGAGAITGLLPATEAARLIMEGLGFAALRAGVANGPDFSLR